MDFIWYKYTLSEDRYNLEGIYQGIWGEQRLGTPITEWNPPILCTNTDHMETFIKDHCSQNNILINGREVEHNDLLSW